jgi:CO/xanthine dehydrogenase FAD-binding subunit
VHVGKYTIKIGALTRSAEIEHDAGLRESCPALMLAA